MTPEKIKKLRLDMGMSLSEFGEATGYSKERIRGIESFGRPIPEDMVKTLKAALKKRLKIVQKAVDDSCTW